MGIAVFHLDTVLTLMKGEKKKLKESKFKEPSEDNLNMAQMIEFILDEFENIGGKGENAVYQYFPLIPLCF